MNRTFFPMHFRGLGGMPRRIPNYPEAFRGWNEVASIGSIRSALSVRFFFGLIYKAFADDEAVGSFPWVFTSVPADRWQYRTRAMNVRWRGTYFNMYPFNARKMEFEKV